MAKPTIGVVESCLPEDIYAAVKRLHDAGMTVTAMTTVMALPGVGPTRIYIVAEYPK